MFQLDLINLSPERLPSLRPKRDLTLGGVPKVSHTHSLLLEPLILVAPLYLSRKHFLPRFQPQGVSRKTPQWVASLLASRKGMGGKKAKTGEGGEGEGEGGEEEDGMSSPQHLCSQWDQQNKAWRGGEVASTHLAASSAQR